MSSKCVALLALRRSQVDRDEDDAERDRDADRRQPDAEDGERPPPIPGCRAPPASPASAGPATSTPPGASADAADDGRRAHSVCSAAARPNAWPHPPASSQNPSPGSSQATRLAASADEPRRACAASRSNVRRPRLLRTRRASGVGHARRSLRARTRRTAWHERSARHAISDRSVHSAPVARRERRHGAAMSASAAQVEQPLPDVDHDGRQRPARGRARGGSTARTAISPSSSGANSRLRPAK